MAQPIFEIYLHEAEEALEEEPSFWESMPTKPTLWLNPIQEDPNEEKKEKIHSSIEAGPLDLPPGALLSQP